MHADEGSPVRLNLGAGYQARPGWIAYDRALSPVIVRNRVLSGLVKVLQRAGIARGSNVLAWPADTRVHDLRKGVPHATASVDMVYSSNMLEHIDPDEAQFILDECHRVLKPGGLLRLVVPDLEVIARGYLGRDQDIFPFKEEAIADAFIRSLYLRERPRGNWIGRNFRRLLRTDDGGHKWMYDGESLTLRLRRAGFTRIERVARGEGTDHAAAALDVRSPHHLHFEAFKASQ